MASIAPQQTVYASNLNESIPKDELKRSLYSQFSQFGRILDVVALKTRKMRGQAFVVFTDVKASASAIHQLQGTVVYGRPIRLAFSKNKSFAAMKEDGSYVKEMRARQKKAAAGTKPAAVPVAATPASTHMDTTTTTTTSGAAADEQPENSILFLGNLPVETTSDMLTALFGDEFDGFKEVRQIGGRPDIAFVEYESVMQATLAKNTLQGFLITPKNPMAITYAKK